MLLMYLIALVPVFVGSILWVLNKKVVWAEWAGGCAIAFIVSGLTHLITIKSMTYDQETWSGIVQNVHRTPQWKAEWTELETYTTTDSKGRTSTHTRTVTKRKTHYPDWWVETNVGIIKIKESKYKELYSKFGKENSKNGYRPNFDSGDRMDYYLVNINNWEEPVNIWKSWENRVKAAPSVFSYPKVPKDSPVFNYPENKNVFKSDRLMGRASSLISLIELDKLNGRLGPRAKVNIIIIGFGENLDQNIAHLQEAHWIGGKKNDLVICFGGGIAQKAGWSYVFGWTERELVKRNLESIFLNNDINTDILKLVNNEILANYQIKDWDKFDYISIEPPLKAYISLFFIMILTQSVFWIWAHHNDLDKSNFQRTIMG